MPPLQLVVPGDEMPDIRAQPAILWEALGREETSTFVDWPEAYMPRETWQGTYRDLPARVAFRHAQTPGKSLDHREPMLELELPLKTRGFRLAFYRSPDESLSPLPVPAELLVGIARRAEAIPVSVGSSILADGFAERLATVAPRIEEIVVDDDKVVMMLRLWPKDAATLVELLDLVHTLRARAEEKISAAAGKEGTLTNHPDVLAARERLAAREAAGRRRTAIIAGLLFGIPLVFFALYRLLRG